MRCPILPSSLTNPQNAEEFFPPKPFRPPARERSLQGKDAVARETVGISEGERPWISPDLKWCGLLGKEAKYISSFWESMSLANATPQPAFSRPILIRPMPAKNSAKVFLFLIAMSQLITLAGLSSSVVGLAVRCQARAPILAEPSTRPVAIDLYSTGHEPYLRQSSFPNTLGCLMAFASVWGNHARNNRRRKQSRVLPER